MDRPYRNFGLLSVVVAVFFLAHHFWPRPSIHEPLPPPSMTSPDSISRDQPSSGLDFDTFQTQLAEQVNKAFGGGAGDKHFSVAVVPMEFDVGTLFNDHDWVPLSTSGCLPKPAPGARPAGHIFTSYSISTATALQASLGSAALQKLTSASANMSHSSSFDYSIDDVAATIMDDESVDQVTSGGECGRFISSHPGARLVRGALSGKITFRTIVDDPASFKAQFSNLGGVSINDDPGKQTVAVSDKQNQQIVVLLTQFEPGLDATARPVQKAVTPSPNRSPASEDAITHIYVQQDATDSPDAGAKIVAALKLAWPKAKVETKVQTIPTQRMPDKAQVRFFNASDIEVANKCRDFLKATNLNANVVRVGLPAPSRQLEVWLPKVR